MNSLVKLIIEKISGVELPERGSDIHNVMRIAPEQALTGGPFRYFLKASSKKLIVKIPPGIKNGQKIRLAGMGDKGKGGGDTGDLFLKILVKKPFVRRIRDGFSTLMAKH